MFLDPEISRKVLDWINSFWNWINSDLEAANAFFIISVIIGGCIGWRLRELLFRYNKRQEAKTTIYPSINLSSQQLEEALNENDRLFTSTPYNCNNDKGNIYTLYYFKSKRKEYCGAYHEIDEEELNRYKTLSQKLKGLLNNQNNMINPKMFEKKKWYECIKTLSDFCDFIINYEYNSVGERDLQFEQEGNEPFHIESCRKLIDAFEYIKRTT